MEKRKDNSKKIIGALLFIILINSICLYQNINSGASGNNNPEIGILTFKRQTIERKYDSDVVWDKIESGLTIRNKDTIRSGDYSDAVLTLKDNTKININENSMIYLDVSDDGVNLNFAYGSMSLEKKESAGPTDSTVKIKSGNNTVEVKNSTLTMEKSSKGDLKFQVKEGSAKILNGKEEKQLKANEAAKLNDKEVVISEISINLLSPSENATISSSSSLIPVKFEWSSKNSIKQKVEVALDSKFQNIYKSFNASGNSTSSSLESGTYYWRVVVEGKNKNKEYSPYRKITVYSLEQPAILSPKAGQIFSFSELAPIVEFRWKKINIARNYKLEISKNSSFTDSVKSYNSSQTFQSVDRLEVGTYFARISIEPISEEFKVSKSEIISFTLQKKTQVEPPILISPSNGLEMNKIIFQKSGYLFQVKDSPEYSSYIFQFSNNSSFNTILSEQNSKTNSFKFISKLEPSTYYWRVIALTLEGKKTFPSQIGNFIIRDVQAVELYLPANNSVKNIEEGNISFQWKRLSYPSKFLFEISESPDFSKILYSSNTNEYSINYNFTKDGKYYWRVQSFSEDNVLLAKSNSFIFTIEDMKDPVAVHPVKFEKVDMSSQNTINFQWQRNPKALFFQLELYKEKPGADELLVKTKVKGNSFVYKELNKLDEGNFRWSIQAFFNRSGEQVQGKKILIPFKIYLSDKPDAPKIKTQKKMYVD